MCGLQISPLKQMQKASEAVKKCQAKKCPKEIQQSNKQKDAFLDEVVSLTQSFAANKITVAQYKKKTDALKKQVLEGKPTQNLSKCSFQKCNKETQKMTKDVQKIMNTECKKGNKGACVIEKKAAKVKSLTDYKAFIKSLAA